MRQSSVGRLYTFLVFFNFWLDIGLPWAVPGGTVQTPMNHNLNVVFGPANKIMAYHKLTAVIELDLIFGYRVGKHFVDLVQHSSDVVILKKQNKK